VGTDATGRQTAAEKPGSPVDSIRVMVADDSAVVRGLINRMLEAEGDLSVVASVPNGTAAVSQIAQRKPIDVVVLDIEMPVMDGLTALREMLKLDPGLPVIMASTLTQHNARVSLQALDLGAADYVPKPSTQRLGGHDEFRRQLVDKVRTFGGRRRLARGPLPVSTAPTAAAPVPPSSVAAAIDRRPSAAPARGISLRQSGRGRPEVIAIGSSTGGPQALRTLLTDLRPEQVTQPLVVTQHMPPTFTAILAEHLQRQCGWTCAEAEDGVPLTPRLVLIAPGDRHMLIVREACGPVVRLTRDPPEHFCRPSVDPMLRSLVQVFGGNILAVILTGMGSDGCAGGRSVVEAGGTLIAQDEATSVVWGMPGAVAQAGLCATVLPLDRMAEAIAGFAARRVP
jgi:two-component system chemotaxis response regulator CheB